MGQPDRTPGLSRRTASRFVAQPVAPTPASPVRLTFIALAALVSLTLLISASPSAATAEVFPVWIVNDTASDVVVRDCADFCASSPLTLNLQSGSRAQINRVAGAHKYFSITTVEGARLGCVDAHFAVPAPNATVPISSARPCAAGGGGVSRGGIGLAFLVALTIAVVIFRRRRSPPPRRMER